MNEPTPSKQERRRKWIEDAKYQGDNADPKLGCCGGDYCRFASDGHNAYIADYWLAVLEEEREAIYKEIRNRILEDVHWAEKLPAFIGNKLNQ